MAYRYEAISVAGFVQQLAVSYVVNGYYFYVTGQIPEAKDPALTDRKIIAQYGVDVSKWTRSRRKAAGEASVQYLRFDRFYVILANHGAHKFFAAEANRLKDIRRSPIQFMGYSIGCRRARGGGNYHASVRISRETYKELKARFTRVAVKRQVEQLCYDLRHLPFEPYAPVRSQLCGLLRAINYCRSVAGLEAVPREALRLRRNLVQPFRPEPGSSQ